MMRPVGVGLMSRGPIGVEGLTMTAGSLSFAIISLDQALGHDLAALVGADGGVFGERRGFVDGAPSSRSFNVATLLV